MELRRMPLHRVLPHQLPSAGRCPDCGVFAPCYCSRTVDHYRVQYRKCPQCNETSTTVVALPQHEGDIAE